MTRLPVSNWKTPTLLGGNEGSHVVTVTDSSGRTLTGELLVAQEKSIQFRTFPGGAGFQAIYTLFLGECHAGFVSATIAPR